MSDGLDLEQRYRRVLRLLPGYHRQQWEEDMSHHRGKIVRSR